MAFDDFIKEEKAVFEDYYKNWKQYIAKYPFLTSFVQAYNMMDEYVGLSRSWAEFADTLSDLMYHAEQAMNNGLIPTISDDKPLEKLEAYLAYYEPIRQKKY